MTKVLVVGHTGFIGSSLVSFLRGIDSVEVFTFSQRITWESKSALISFLRLHDFDYAYFLADVNGNSSWLSLKSYSQFSLNSSLSLLFIDSIVASETSPKVIYLGSAWSMPPNVASATESDFINSSPSGRLKPYALSKKVTYDALHLAKSEHGLAFTYFITCTVVGPTDRSDHLIPTLYRKIKDGQSGLEINSDGSEIRSFIHVSDLVKGLFLLRDVPHEVFNLTSGNSDSIYDLCQFIKDHLDRKIDFSFTSTPGIHLPLLSTELSESACCWPSAFRLKPLRAIIEDVFSTLEK